MSEVEQHAAMMHHIHVVLLRAEVCPQTLQHSFLPRGKPCLSYVCWRAVFGISRTIFPCVFVVGTCFFNPTLLPLGLHLLTRFWVLFGIVSVCLSDSTATSLHAEHHLRHVVFLFAEADVLPHTALHRLFNNAAQVVSCRGGSGEVYRRNVNTIDEGRRTEAVLFCIYTFEILVITSYTIYVSVKTFVPRIVYVNNIFLIGAHTDITLLLSPAHFKMVRGAQREKQYLL